MKLILFTKMLRGASVDDLVRIAKAAGIDGFDLCVRYGYPIDPDNVEIELPKLVQRLAESNVEVPMITGEGWEPAESPTSRRMLAAMEQAGVPFYKLGYVFYRPWEDGDYWENVDRIRTQLSGWERLAEKHGVKVCYHTHCSVPGLKLGHYLGTNCAAVMHLIRGFDPRFVGVYVGTANLLIDGEPFEYGLSMIRKHLSIVELQDVHLQRVPAADEGRHTRFWTTAGNGAVEWSEVFSSLGRVGFDGPLTMHAEFTVPSNESFEDLVIREAAYFKKKIAQCNVTVSTANSMP